MQPPPPCPLPRPRVSIVGARRLSRATVVVLAVTTACACASTDRSTTIPTPAGESTAAPSMQTETTNITDPTLPPPTTARETTAPSTSAAAPTSMSPETAPPTTDIENPFTDAEIATRILLDPEEYGADWQLFSNYKAVTLDAALAEQIEGCARFAEIVFESGAGPGVTASRWFHAPPGRSGAMSQYVVVLATEAAAVAMFDATVDPDFRSECFVPYVELAADPTGYCCDPTVPFAAALVVSFSRVAPAT